MNRNNSADSTNLNNLARYKAKERDKISSTISSSPGSSGLSELAVTKAKTLITPIT